MVEGTAVRAGTSASVSESIHACLGKPVRVTLIDSRFDDPVMRLFGALEAVTTGVDLTVSCLGIPSAIPKETRAVVEVLQHGEMLFLFTASVWPVSPGRVRLDWPKEVRTQQRRRHPRVDATLPLHYLVAGTDLANRGLIENISAGGLAFITESPLAENDELSLAFGIGSGCFLQETRARVLRCTQSTTGKHRVAVEFISMDPEAQRHLVAWITQQRKSVEFDEEFAEHL